MRLAIPLARAASASAGAVVKLKVGDVLRSARRRFTAEDVAAYAAATGDLNPLHLDDAFARSGSAGAVFAQGMLTASLLPALIASRFPGSVCQRHSLSLAAPVFVGDEAGAEVRALSIDAAGERRMVRFAAECFTYAKCDDDELKILTVQGEVTAFLPTLRLSPEAPLPETSDNKYVW
ncbi:hypothetical protein ACQ4PT_004849 [Festuca glaucescens]